METVKFIGSLVVIGTIVVVALSWFEPVKAQVVKYELKGLLPPGSAYSFEGKWWTRWNLGTEFTLDTATPVIVSHMKDMEGNIVRITIEVVDVPKKKK